jgi:hypothetical protein
MKSDFPDDGLNKFRDRSFLYPKKASRIKFKITLKNN